MTLSKHWKMYVDGASRGNPGPGGAGIFLSDNKEITVKRGYFLGKRTNNEAEYLALLIGIFLVKKEGKPGDKIHVFSDSLLLVKQMTGEYRVKKPELQVLHRLIKEHAASFVCTFEHVYRENNVQADALANAGVDTKTQLPLSFISLLRAHEIHI